MSIKLRSCEVMQEFQYYDTNDLDVLESRIKSLNQLKDYAFIVHDKDIDEFGNIKPIHFHCVLIFNNATTIDVIAKKMLVKDNYVNKIKTTPQLAMAYLIHKNEPDKHQYDVSEVRHNEGFNYEEYIKDTTPKQNRKNIASMISNGVIKRYNITDYIDSNDYAVNKVYYDRCFEWRENKMKTISRDIDVMYIWGDSGVGKTTLAKILARKQNYKPYITSGGKNPLDDYKGEDCIIFDDVGIDNNYNLKDLLKLLDNNTSSLVGCRYYNKSIYECKQIILTNTKSPESFYRLLPGNAGETSTQFYRRIGTTIHMTHDLISVSVYDKNSNSYKLIQEGKNSVTDYYDTVRNNKTAQNVAKMLRLNELMPFEEVKDDEMLPF